MIAHLQQCAATLMGDMSAHANLDMLTVATITTSLREDLVLKFQLQLKQRSSQASKVERVWRKISSFSIARKKPE